MLETRNHYERRQSIQLKHLAAFAWIRPGRTLERSSILVTPLSFPSRLSRFLVNVEFSHLQGTHLDHLRLQCLAVPGTAGNLRTIQVRRGHPTRNDDSFFDNRASFLFASLWWSRRNQGRSCSGFTPVGSVTFLRQELALFQWLVCRATRFSSNSVPPITASRFRRLRSSTLRKRRTVTGVMGRVSSSRNPGSTATSSIDREFRSSDRALCMSSRLARADTGLAAG
jgi:hypothetical protein